MRRVQQMNETCVILINQTTKIDNIPEKVLTDTLDFTNQLKLLIDSLRDKCSSKIDSIKNNRGTVRS